MRNFLIGILSLVFLLISSVSALTADPDKKGSRDHPLLSRMPDFHIYDYQDQDFAAYNFIGADGKRIPVEGHYYFIKYFLDRGAAKPGELKIVRNVQNALRKIGGEVLHESNRLSTVVVRQNGRETWVEVQAWPAEYILKIVEKEEMKQEVVADAAALANGIRTTGHVPVYGIFFDTGKAEIKTESAAALAEIAKLLQSDGTLKLFVVGHTDTVGSFESNLQLSKDRAQAVVDELAGKYAIAAVRLQPHGVASLAPVASNDTEAGRARNRRVELVKQ